VAAPSLLVRNELRTGPQCLERGTEAHDRV